MHKEIAVQTNCKQDEVIQTESGLKVRVKAQPIDGKANEAVIKLLAKHFGVHTSQIEIVSGNTSKKKRVRIN